MGYKELRDTITEWISRNTSLDGGLITDDSGSWFNEDRQKSIFLDVETKYNHTLGLYINYDGLAFDTQIVFRNLLDFEVFSSVVTPQYETDMDGVYGHSIPTPKNIDYADTIIDSADFLEFVVGVKPYEKTTKDLSEFTDPLFKLLTYIENN